jgi:hypothetical protein
LGAVKTVDMDIYWASGAVEHFKNITADQLVTVVEGKGVVPGKNLTGAVLQKPPT